MIKKGLITLTLMFVMMPMLAQAFFLTTKVNTAGGQLQAPGSPVQTSGSVMKSYPNGVNVDVVVTANAGYTLSKVQVGANYVTPTPTANPYTYTFVAPVTSQTIGVWFAKQLTSVSAFAGVGGSVSPSGTLNLQAGTVKSYTFTPNAGKNVVSITGVPAGATVTPAVPAAANTAVTVSFTVPATAVTMQGSFQSLVANAGSAQTVLTSKTVTLNGSASVGATTYAWTQTSGPAVTLSDATAANPTFAAAAAGAYRFQLVVSDGTVSSSPAVATVTVTDSIAAAMRNQCQDCHQPLGIGSTANVYSNWSSSKHNSQYVLCANCHVGANTGSHPGAAVTSATCEGCHAAALSTTTHPVAITASKCLVCHNSHDPAAGIANLGSAPAHPAVTLYTFEEIGMQMAGGAKVPVQVDASGKGMPYSPKQTCGTSGCHVKNGIDYTYDKISDHAFHSNEGRSEYQDSADGKLSALKNKPWGQSTAMVGKW